jgi:hypothetical protein
MSVQSQAELLIKTLAELRDAECEREAARLRLQCKAHARRFILTFRPELIDGGPDPTTEPGGAGAGPGHVGPPPPITRKPEGATR